MSPPVVGRLLARAALTGLLAALLASCTTTPVEQRPGYRVDHRHVAMSHSSRVRHLVIHYTDADETASLDALTGPRVSSHYLIPPPRRGRPPPVYQLVEESRRAWHAGASGWAGRENLNDTSIGIEIVNTGPDRSFAELEAGAAVTWAPYPAPQVTALVALARDIIARHGIAPTDVVSHAEIAPTRKIDPGPAFPWQRLHAAGIGPWPAAERVAWHRARLAQVPLSLEYLQRGLAAWGLPLTATGCLDEATRGALRAFQMRYRPSDYRGLPDVDTAARLWALLEAYRPAAHARLVEKADPSPPCDARIGDRCRPC